MSEVGRMGTYVVIPSLECEDFLSLDLTCKDYLEIVDNKFEIDNSLSIDLSTGKVWEGRLDRGFKWKKEKLNKENLKILDAALKIYAAENSAYRKIFNLKEHYLVSVCKNLCSFDLEDSKVPCVKSLIGLGAGLTPMGDDLLTGFLSVVTSCSEGAFALEEFKKSINENLFSTNYISSNMLLNAIDGIYHEYIQDLVYAVAYEDTDRVFFCAKKLLKIGATSGTDLATGIYLGFKSISQGKAR